MADDTFYYPSSGEEAYFEKLRHLIAKHPHDIRHYLDLFSVYTSRRAFIRLLAHYELFKMTIDLPGHYVDFGVYFGKSFFSWHKFLEIFAPTATHKKVIGFDTFAGFQNFVARGRPKRSSNPKGGWRAKFSQFPGGVPGSARSAQSGFSSAGRTRNITERPTICGRTSAIRLDLPGKDRGVVAFEPLLDEPLQRDVQVEQLQVDRRRAMRAQIAFHR